MVGGMIFLELVLLCHYLILTFFFCNLEVISNDFI